MDDVVEDRFVTSDAGRLFARRWHAGKASRAPIVLLHDSLGSVAQWRGFPQALGTATSRDVIAYDRLGYGQSDARHSLPSADFIREEAATGFAALRVGLQLERFVLFGHSVGGGMALEIAAAEGQRCVAVISESAQAFVEERTRDGIGAAKVSFATIEQLARLKRWHGDKARWVLEAWTEVWLSHAFEDWSLRETLPRVHCPVLAIHGDHDEFGSLAFPRTITEGVSGPSQLAILEDCGHVPHREHEAVVLALVERFLASVR